MKKYQAIINTSAYEKIKCSNKNLEAGSINDYMQALNGWNTILNTLDEVRWQLEMFNGTGPGRDCWNDNGNGFTKKYKDWRDKPENTITYLDKLCMFEKTSRIEAYGFKQGYIPINSVLEELENKGIVRVPFKWCYDSRQYIKNLDNCYMEIKVVAE